MPSSFSLLRLVSYKKNVPLKTYIIVSFFFFLRSIRTKHLQQDRIHQRPSSRTSSTAYLTKTQREKRLVVVLVLVLAERQQVLRQQTGVMFRPNLNACLRNPLQVVKKTTLKENFNLRQVFHTEFSSLY